MMAMDTRRNDNREVWDALVHDMQGHPLQLWGWGQLKSRHNWRVIRVEVHDGDTIIGGAQLLIRPLPRPFNAFVYVPRGPFALPGRETEVLDRVADFVRLNCNAVLLSIEPDAANYPVSAEWRRAAHTILIPRTLILDLSQPLEQLLAAMTKKTRQYIRKSEREPLEIRRVTSHDDITACLEIYHQTAQRAGFALHDDQYYHDLHDEMGESSIIVASYHDGQPVAFLWLALSATTAFELYGGMNDLGQQLRANYSLKWHAITTCKGWGVARYDMNGLLNDGVSTFKQGFASHETMLAGTYDLPLSPLYFAWTKGLPFAKKTIRRLKSLRK